MPPKSNNISGDEMYLRLHAPKFFKELIDSRTATLMEAGNPEDLTAWKQERQQKDQLWKEMIQETPGLQQQVLDKEIFQKAVQGYAQEVSKLDPKNIDPEVMEASIADLIQGELDPLWDNNAPPLDMRFVAAAQIDKHREQERDDRDLSGKSMSEQGPNIREEYLRGNSGPSKESSEAVKDLMTEQETVGKEVQAMKNEQAIENAKEGPKQEMKVPLQKIDPPSND